ncbi:MAG: PAS domain-containing protein [Desulfosudis oleivorans]|nr:PAS domain-containing protein [Desulfosudis oleivorans]
MEANESFLQKMGYTRAQVIGRKCHEVYHKIDHPCQRSTDDCPLQKVIQNQRRDRQLQKRVLPNGDIRHYEVSLYPIWEKKRQDLPVHPHQPRHHRAAPAGGGDHPAPGTDGGRPHPPVEGNPREAPAPRQDVLARQALRLGGARDQQPDRRDPQSRHAHEAHRRRDPARPQGDRAVRPLSESDGDRNLAHQPHRLQSPGVFAPVPHGNETARPQPVDRADPDPQRQPPENRQRPCGDAP